MRSSWCFAAAVCLALLAAACQPQPVVLSGDPEFPPGTRLVQTIEQHTEGLQLELTLDRFTFPGMLQIDQRVRFEIEVVSDSEMRIVVGENVIETGLTLEGEKLPTKTVHGPLAGVPLVGRRGEDGWEVTLAKGAPTAEQQQELRRLSLGFGDSGYPEQAMSPGDEAELDTSAFVTAMGGLLVEPYGSGTVKLRDLATHHGFRGAELTVTFYSAGELAIPGFDRAKMELALQGDVFRSLEHNLDLDYEASGEITFDGAMHDARGVARLAGKGKMLMTSHTTVEQL